MQNNKMEKEKINCCVKCDHGWKQRGKKKPKKCPSCTSPNWDKRTNQDLINLIVGDSF
jgi:hypothetical protein